LKKLRATAKKSGDKNDGGDIPVEDSKNDPKGKPDAKAAAKKDDKKGAKGGKGEPAPV
jgi:hypothetical protein